MSSGERYSSTLTPEEILVERLHLAHDMLFLALFDGMELSPAIRQRVQALFANLMELRAELESSQARRRRKVLPLRT
jgi:hypothetical protein